MRIVDPNVRLAADGDRAAFEALYTSYHRRVYGLCLRMTRNASDAEDLTQDVFVQLFRKLKTFRGESSFTTWLHRLTLNEVLMHFRRPVVRREQTTEDGTTPIQIKTASGTLRMSLVDHISLNEAIRQLSPGYRAVFFSTMLRAMSIRRLGRS
jgi:RNA polymerase sigma-70 factor, ECF subfamily